MIALLTEDKVERSVGLDVCDLQVLLGAGHQVLRFRKEVHAQGGLPVQPRMQAHGICKNSFGRLVNEQTRATRGRRARAARNTPVHPRWCLKVSCLPADSGRFALPYLLIPLELVGVRRIEGHNT